jgi:hypothetical protein
VADTSEVLTALVLVFAMIRLLWYPPMCPVSPRLAPLQVAIGGEFADTEGSCEYIEKAVADIRQGVVL